ncbi:hypothetical protein INS49_006130 [Diaporthe citri]|uniref:uncharacterized protein n=1 Tax=Diaporthe citri TaxID=83186 RepID=UPI001C8278C1|nr:uncharacterized protein INS49_006130 [Diaporthe citri]KAG6364529.1 hypothetical protein INS49_006130 [Diaporthe citri]
MRIVQNIACRAVSGQGYAAMRPCAQIDSDGVLPKFLIESSWPECEAYFTGRSPDQQVLVKAEYYGLPIEINVAISIVSGASAFVALFLHAMGVELYLHLTSGESERLRQASYHRQSASGQRHSPRAGSDVDNFEDSAKMPPHGHGKAEIGGDAASETSFEAATRR